MAILFGWDASDFDHGRGMRAGHIKKAAEQGIRFFTHKITEGTTTVHSHAGRKLKAAHAAGIPFLGAYLVTRTPGNNRNGSVSEQVDFAIQQTTRQFPQWKQHDGWFWQVDLEHWEYDKVAAKYGVKMCELLEKRTGRKAILYAPRWAYTDSVGGSAPLWASDYRGSGSPANFKTQWARTAEMKHPGWNKYSGRKPVILQYSSDARIGGQHTCDANVYDGSEADFRSLITLKRPAGKLLSETSAPVVDAAERDVVWAPALAMSRPGATAVDGIEVHVLDE
jgi:Glycosyl hydrolases family 25